MARILTEGFEMGDAVGWTLGASSAIVTSQKRSGAYALYSNSSTSTNLVWDGVPSVGELYARVAIRIATVPGTLSEEIITFGSHGALRLNLSSRKLQAYCSNPNTLLGTGSIVLQLNTWYLIEAHYLVHDTAGVFQVKVDGVLDIDLSNVDTRDGATTTIDSLTFGQSYTNYSSSICGYIDDIAVNDTTGAVDNSWCGDGRIIALKPNANGDSSQFVGSDANSTDNYLLVDEVPSDSDTTYVESGTADQVDLYNVEASGLAGVTISRVWAESRSRATVGDGTGKIRHLIVSGATTAEDAADTALLTTYTKRCTGDPLLTDPNTSAAWTVAALDALQVGVKAK